MVARRPKTGRKPTRDEIDGRVEFTWRLLAARVPKSEIKRQLKDQYNVTARTCENYLARARAMILEDTGRDKVEHRGESLAYYLSIMQSPSATNRVRLLAQTRIDKLLGLEDRTAEDGLEALLARLPADLGREIRAAIAANLSPPAAGEGGPPGP